jgi:hypothetical protein
MKLPLSYLTLLAFSAQASHVYLHLINMRFRETGLEQRTVSHIRDSHTIIELNEQSIEPSRTLPAFWVPSG